jgi:hypothetical protein
MQFKETRKNQPESIFTLPGRTPDGTVDHRKGEVPDENPSMPHERCFPSVEGVYKLLVFTLRFVFGGSHFDFGILQVH